MYLDVHFCLPFLHQHLCSCDLPGAAGPAVAHQHLSVACRISVRCRITHAAVTLLSRGLLQQGSVKAHQKRCSTPPGLVQHSGSIRQPTAAAYAQFACWEQQHHPPTPHLCRGVEPVLSCAFTLAPALSRREIMAILPLEACRQACTESLPACFVESEHEPATARSHLQRPVTALKPKAALDSNGQAVC